VGQGQFFRTKRGRIKTARAKNNGSAAGDLPAEALAKAWGAPRWSSKPRLAGRANNLI